MKNVTVSLDDELYRRSRTAAAMADTTVTALVRQFLTLLTEEQQVSLASEKTVEQVIERIRAKHPGFQTRNPLTRDQLHQRA